jgi:hypothetical protein
MKLLFHSIVLTAAAAAGLAVGFAWRTTSERNSLNTDSFSVRSAPEQMKRPAKLRETNDNRAKPFDDSVLATQLERDLSMSEGVTRWLYWLDAIEKAAPPDFPRLAVLAQNDSIALRLLAARWIDVAPRHLFDTIVARSRSGQSLPSEFGNLLMTEWAKRDPQALISALSEENEWGHRPDWRRQVAGNIIEHNAELGLRLFSEWNIDNFGPRMTAIAKWAAANPLHAAEFTLDHPAGYASRLAMETIGEEWAKSDPPSALKFAGSHHGELVSEMEKAVVKTWTEQNTTQVAEWLGGTDASARNRLGPPFVEAWAKKDASAALTWSESNLSGSALAEAARGVLKSAAEKDVAVAARLVSGMTPSTVRAEGALAVAEKWLPNHNAWNEPVPSETIAWLRSLDLDSVKHVLNGVQWQWSSSDPKSFADFLTLLNNDQIPTRIYSSLVRSMARRNPLETIQWAESLPENSRLTVAGQAFSEWRMAQPDSAMQWLGELSPRDPRRRTFFETAIRDLSFDGHDTRAAETLAALSEADRAAAREVIEAASLPADRRELLLKATRSAPSFSR